MTSAAVDPIGTPARVDCGVYVTSTPCEHETEVRVGIALYANRRDAQGAQCKACNTRWRLWFTGDSGRGAEAFGG